MLRESKAPANLLSQTEPHVVLLKFHAFSLWNFTHTVPLPGTHLSLLSLDPTLCFTSLIVTHTAVLDAPPVLARPSVMAHWSIFVGDWLFICL